LQDCDIMKNRKKFEKEQERFKNDNKINLILPQYEEYVIRTF